MRAHLFYPLIPVVSLLANPAAAGSPQLLFDDEFTGSSLDTTKWYTCYFYQVATYGCTNWNSSEQSFEIASNVSVSNGLLHLKARAQVKTIKYGSQSKVFHYSSAMVQTGGSPTSNGAFFQFTYGYAEMRARFPAGNELWPAFWLLERGPWPPEIDIVEGQSLRPETVYATDHWGPNGVDHANQTAYVSGVALSSGYHTYGLDWEPNYLKWYFDGKLIKTVTAAKEIPSAPMFILVSLAVGDFLGQPQTPTVPVTMQVDYVRVWTSKP